MLEYGEYKGHLYGTSVDAVQAVLDEGKICVMDLEPQVGLWWSISHLPKVMNACHPFYAHALGCSETLYSVRIRPLPISKDQDLT